MSSENTHSFNTEYLLWYVLGHSDVSKHTFTHNIYYDTTTLFCHKKGFHNIYSVIVSYNVYYVLFG